MSLIGGRVVKCPLLNDLYSSCSPSVAPCCCLETGNPSHLHASWLLPPCLPLTAQWRYLAMLLDTVYLWVTLYKPEQRHNCLHSTLTSHTKEYWELEELIPSEPKTHTLPKDVKIAHFHCSLKQINRLNNLKKKKEVWDFCNPLFESLTSLGQGRAWPQCPQCLLRTHHSSS